jgi:hypothetical protein
MKYSNFRFLVEYVVILLSCYFLTGLLVSFVCNIDYRTSLQSEYHIPLLLLLYWWLPVFRMADMENHNLRNN